MEANKAVGYPKRPVDFVKDVVLAKLDRECGDNQEARRKRLYELRTTEGLSEVGHQALRELLEELEKRE